MGLGGCYPRDNNIQQRLKCCRGQPMLEVGAGGGRKKRLKNYFQTKRIIILYSSYNLVRVENCNNDRKNSSRSRSGPFIFFPGQFHFSCTVLPLGKLS